MTEEEPEAEEVEEEAESEEAEEESKEEAEETEGPEVEEVEEEAVEEAEETEEEELEEETEPEMTEEEPEAEEVEEETEEVEEEIVEEPEETETEEELMPEEEELKTYAETTVIPTILAKSEEAEKDSYSSYAGGSNNVDYVQDNTEDYRSTPQYDDYDEKVKDSGSIGWGILGFFLPIVGLILFIAWHNSRPNSARAAGLGALISVIVNIILSIISFIVLGIGSALFFNDSGVNVDSYVEEFRAILQSLMA